MPITINYKGWEFEFDALPSSDQIKARYDEQVARSEIVIPVPRPVPLVRDKRPYSTMLLASKKVRAWNLSGSISEMLTASGAELVGDSEASALVFDARPLRELRELRLLYECLSGALRALAKNGRVVVLCGAADLAESDEQAAVWQATDAFVRSVAREVGIMGATANRIVVGRDADPQAAWALVYLLSDKSAFVSQQTLEVSVGPHHPEHGLTSRLLDSRTAVVTGAAGGIGRATAELLAQEGASVVCVDLPTAPGLDEVHRFGGVPCGVDITAPQAADRIAELLPSGVDIVVHNAGIVRDAMLQTMSPDVWDRVLAVNVEAPATLTRSLASAGLLNDWGRVVYVSSIVGISGSMGQTNYASSKAAMLGLTRHQAREFGERGITVNAVAPGTTDTHQVAGASSLLLDAGRRLNALSQIGRRDDAANAVVFLCTPRSQGITGTCVRVCGGALPGA